MSADPSMFILPFTRASHLFLANLPRPFRMMAEIRKGTTGGQQVDVNPKNPKDVCD